MGIIPPWPPEPAIATRGFLGACTGIETTMNKMLIALLLSSGCLMLAVQCEGPVESEPNGTFDEAWDNPNHPVLHPNVGLVSGNLAQDDTRDDWWIMTNDTPIMRMRDADIAKLPSPFTHDKKPHRYAEFGVSRLEFGQARYADIKAQAHTKMRFNIEAFPTIDERSVTLEVEMCDSRNLETKVVMATIHNGIYKENALRQPEITTLSGKVEDEPDSLVFLALQPNGNTYGFIRRTNQTTFLSMDSTESKPVPILFDPNRVPEELLPAPPALCETIDLFGVQRVGDDGDTATAHTPFRRIDLAIDTDFEFTQDLFAGNTSNAVAYVITLISAASAIYTDQLNIELDLTYLRLWENSSDPYDNEDTVSQLYALRGYWEDTMNDVDRDLTHLLSGRPGGGIAFYPGLCAPTYGYGLSRVDGSFPSPVSDFNPSNWDIFVFTHELGHNLGAPHTHDYCPPLDQCAPNGFFGECQSTQVCRDDGTIMSYCHTCTGGMRNIALRFHEEVKATILNYLDGAECGYTSDQPSTLFSAVLVAPDSDLTATLQRIIWEHDGTWYYEVIDQFDLSVPAYETTQAFNLSFEFDARDPYVYTFEGSTTGYLFSLYFQVDED